MKKIISFEKRIDFPSMIGEITAISLEHNLKFIDDNSIEGDLTVSGSYKLTEASRIEEEFSYKLPTDILLTECIEQETAHIDIDDFYYEIQNDYTLVCYVDIKIEGVEKIDTSTLEKENKEEETKLNDIDELNEIVEKPSTIEKLDIKDERECDGDYKQEEMEKENMCSNCKMEVENKQEKESNVNSLFQNINDSEETYSTYSVYILREEETINSLIEKYKTTKEELESYNDINNLSIGSKIIIPYHVKED